MKSFAVVLGSLVYSVLFSIGSIFAQAVVSPPSLSGIDAAGKDITIGTSFDPQSEDTEFRITYYVGGSYSLGCSDEEQPELLAEQTFSEMLVDTPVVLTGISADTLVGKCIWAEAFIMSQEQMYGPSNEITLSNEVGQEPPRNQGSVLGTSTSTSEVLAANTLAETGIPAVVQTIAGVALVIGGTVLAIRPKNKNKV